MYCIMSSNQSNIEGTSGHKRSLDQQSEGEPFVISQEIDDNDIVAAQQQDGSNKRQRTSSMEPDSPGVVSISSAMERPQRVHNTTTATTTDVLNMSVDKPIEWWKQKPIAANTANQHSTPMSVNNDTTQASACFICQRPQEEQQSRYGQGNAPSNSLLCYFSTTRTTSSSSSTTPMNMDTKPPAIEKSTIFQKCTFCDRPVCTSCTRQCEKCQQTFCSLCSTADYSGRLERSFCLDCHAIEQQQQQQNAHHQEASNDDDMHIG